jgi:spermidine synthase
MAVTRAIASEKPTNANSPVQPASLWRLFLVSSAALYLEIVLIRWLGTEVRIFAFFQNLSLIICFLGFGVGCFSQNKRGSLWPSLAATTTLVVAVTLPFQFWHVFLRNMSYILSITPDAALWGHGLELSTSSYWIGFGRSLAVVAGFLLLICVAMIPLGRWVGFYLEAASNTVTAYSVNLLGSLLGIWLLALLALHWLSPSYWFAVAFVLVILAQPISWRSLLISAALMAITLFALQHRGNDSVYWSPYQKITAMDYGDHQYQINVNNVGYMSIANVSPQYLSTHPEFARDYQNSSYDSPFRFVQSPKRVLIVGSGAGNDVAAALRHGAEHIDAVEIDPLISTLGLRLHPEQPYGSPKVHLVNNDARNFMRQCRDKYDVIVFGLLDSHTEFSSYSNMRVDNYVYTEESFREAKRLLNDNGILIVKFEVREPWTWIGQRFYSMLSQIFSHPPLTYYAPATGALFSATVFIESDSPSLRETGLSAQQADFLRTRTPSFALATNSAPPPTTDDWPYVYHYGHSVPRTYFSVSAVILLLAIYCVGPFVKPRESTSWQFFLLGAGFLLMETQLVSRLALYFGTTWLVNCIALTGILVVLLLSNLYIQFRRPKNLTVCYALLCAMLIIDYAIPWNRIPGSGTLVGILICVAYCVPVFFAGIIFTENFCRLSGSSGAFGANMLGAVAGGLAQNLSFIFGMKALLLIATLIYGTSAILQKVKSSRSPAV